MPATPSATRLRRRRPRRGRPDATRERLVAAAAELFNRDGYHGTDSNRIARRAGYAAGTFYKHFRDKRAILLVAWEAWVDAEWAEVGRELSAGGAQAEVAERIVALVLRHHTRWRGLRRSMTALLGEDAEVRRFHREQRRRQLELLRAMRALAGAPARPEAEDAVLLFTLERVCDAVANAELRDLGLDREAVLGVLRAQVASAITGPFATAS